MEQKYAREELITIQKRNKLNRVFCMDGEHPLNKGHHFYRIDIRSENEFGDVHESIPIHFQNGPRKEKGSVQGILDTDLLEIVLHRLKSFQNGPYATRENAITITKIEEALLWMNKRVEDRVEAGTLGTNKI
jgi:hypothetical protein